MSELLYLMSIGLPQFFLKKSEEILLGRYLVLRSGELQLELIVLLLPFHFEAVDLNLK